MKFVSSSHFIKLLTCNWNIHFISFIVQNFMKKAHFQPNKISLNGLNTTSGHTMESGPLLYKNLYKFAKKLHNMRFIHIFATVYVGNKFSSHYRVLFNNWRSHMNLLYAIYNFMKYGVRSLVARTQSLKSSVSRFICLKLVGYSQNHWNQCFSTYFVHLCGRNQAFCAS